MVTIGGNPGRVREGELRRRARRIRLVLTDNDGVLTDNGVYYSDWGEEMKRYSIRDGMGVRRLRDAHVETAIISGERSGSIWRRAEKLQLRKSYLGVADKASALIEILAEWELSCDEVAFIGDDVNDLGIIGAVRDHGLTGAPSDALAAVQAEVHFITASPGGHGAFRDFAEWIVGLRADPDDAQGAATVETTHSGENS